MSRPKEHPAVKLLASFFAFREDLIGEALKSLSVRCGKPDFLSEFLPFVYTDYYSAEMGSPLVRRFASFENLIRPDTLPEIKLFANSIEEQFSLEGKRRVNIDPGYLSRCHLVLATGKGYSHRPYLRDGIYADLTLIYRDRSFHPLEWTYPDYKSQEVTGILMKIREKYIFQLKKGGNSRH